MQLKTSYIIFLILALQACKTEESIQEPLVDLETWVEYIDTVTQLQPPEPEISNPLPPKREKYVLASIKKSPCYGKCPVFEARIYSDGEVVYNGIRHVDKIGVYHAYLTEIEMQSILQKAEALQFFQLAKNYPTDGEELIDFPNTVTYVKKGDEELKVKNNNEAPQNLLDFERFLLAFLERVEWVRE